MNYYQFNINDYLSNTAHLEPIEDLSYRRLIEYYYQTESAITSDMRTLCKRIRLALHEVEVKAVLDEFFTLSDDGLFYKHARCEKEIRAYQEKSEKAAKSANSRWKKPADDASADDAHSDDDANAMRTHSDGNANHKPITINHKPITNKNTQSNLTEESADDDLPDVCRSLRGLGVTVDEQRKNLDKITALVHRGATLEHFSAGLAIANESQKGFNYALGCVKTRLDDAASPRARASPKQSKIENLTAVKNNSLAERVAAQLGVENKNYLEVGT